MRLVLVHGRSQEGRSETIRQEWVEALRAGVKKAGRQLPDDLDIRVPFYGDLLDDYARGRREANAVIARGGEAEVDEFEAAMLDEIRRSMGITDAEVQAELDAEVVARGPENWEWVQALGRVISRRTGPGITDFVLERLLPDINVYLNRPHVTQEVDGVVAAELDDGVPTVVLGHSLGSIVTYRILSARRRPEVRLYATVGSPLAIDAVKKRLPRPLSIPPGVRHWLNAADERDVVALYARLDRNTFVGGIENISDVRNPDEHVHGIVGYLADEYVAARIADAVADA